jgi:hypothetical protein
VFTSGTTDGTTIDRCWSSSTAVTTTPTDHDLIGGLTSNLNGQATSFVDLVGIICVNDGTSGDIQIGAGSNPVTGWVLAAGDGVTVKPGGIFLWLAPNGVAPSAGTADILREVASAGSISQKFVLLGRSA